LCDYKLVFVIEAASLATSSLHDYIFQSFFLGSGISREVFDNVMHCETVQRQILFILDGLDEVVDMNTHLTSLINATNFCHSSVILTSRPQPATSPLNTVTHKLQIMGFNVKTNSSSSRGINK